jgi:hypothetical protein
MSLRSQPLEPVPEDTARVALHMGVANAPLCNLDPVFVIQAESHPVQPCSETARLPITPAILDERALLDLLEGDSKLFLGVHYDGTVPGDGLADRLSRDEKEPHAFRLGSDGDLVAVAEEHQVTVPDQAFALHVEVVPAHGFVAVGGLLLAEHALAANHVREQHVTPWRSVGERLAGG